MIMSNLAAKLAYKPVGLLLGAGAGMVSGLIFKQIWKLAGHDEDAPDATDEDRGWAEVLTAAALQGAIFAVVKAAVDRGGAVGIRKATGRWPG
jgi:predicted metal-dependent enzyme (double-stranded beta helix superfamily)